mgnify:CR=1 FL=1
MNMQALMQQAQKMQRDITKKKEELNAKEFTGSSELVEIVFTGDKKVKSVKIKDGVDADDMEMLEDMITIAINDAMGKIDVEADKILGAYGNQFGGLF